MEPFNSLSRPSTFFFSLAWGVIPLMIALLSFSCAHQEEPPSAEPKAPATRQNNTAETGTHTRPEKPISDRAVAAAVYDLLALGNLSPLSVDVASSNGQVTLSGEIPGENKKRLILKATEKIEGVESVNDELTVVAAATEASASERGGIWGFLLSLLALPLALALIPVILIVAYVEIRLAQRSRKISARESTVTDLKRQKRAS